MTFHNQKTWKNAPSTDTPMDADGLNAMEAGINEASQAAGQLGQARLATGEEVYSRYLTFSSGGASLNSGQLRLVYFTAAKSETITKVDTIVAGTAASATPTKCRIGIYSVAGNGDLTLIASTPNDTALWNATGQKFSKSLSAPFSKVKNTRYAVGTLCVSAGVVPLLAGFNLVSSELADYSPAITKRVLSQTDLPSSVLNSDAVPSTAMPWAALIP